ncbi:MAG: transcription-repair coupling factor [Deltaproteobacteria bacterium CG11_big_fil_rev_8_21_14_0_20_42_23]|nr:MAG: transcription-repair coupling factor [Deltaproteobacteria bacterium CG11_big_fil_rev_8_21_14_0_20_42_23]PJC64938.1 MAG: transcription-repair coupling factor [Deltaproteobacteria bacterium CG_4_9_14_0_2_um_filter_42_21]
MSVRNTISKICETLFTDQLSTGYALQGVHGGAKSYLLSKLVQKNEGCLLILTESNQAAEQLMSEIKSFLDHSENHKLLLYPEQETLPYTQLSGDAETWAKQVEALVQLKQNRALTIISTENAVREKLPPASFLSEAFFSLTLKQNLDRDELTHILVECGYEEFSLVEDIGTFSVRGAIVDLWPPLRETPVRVEFEDDVILSLRPFSPSSQKSMKAKDLLQLDIIPVQKFLFTKEKSLDALEKLRDLAAEHNLPLPEIRSITEKLKQQLSFSGIETFFPLFHQETADFFDYLPHNTLIIKDESDASAERSEKCWKKMGGLHKETQSLEKLIQPSQLFLSPQEANEKMQGKKFLALNAVSLQKENLHLLPSVHFEENTQLKMLIKKDALKHHSLLDSLSNQLKDWIREGFTLLFTCHNEIQAERLKELFSHHALSITDFAGSFSSLQALGNQGLRVRISPLSKGFQYEDEKLIVIAEEEIFGKKQKFSTKASSAQSEAFTSFSEIAPNDLLVHQDHGIGRYLGLEHLKFGDEPGDYLILEYLGGDKLYLPVYRMNLVQRYIGSGDGIVPLDKLGATRWKDLKKKVKEEIRAIAGDLLKIYAERQIKTGYAFPDPGDEYQEFCAQFPYDETPDQERSINETLRDMCSEKPMDRLVCGDVGYGKTEVALRAAFHAANSGKQVAILVPTTILAFQHFDTFKKRLAGFPFHIEMISRFVSKKDQNEILKRLESGSIDIIIGTHALLQNRIKFKNLALLVVDEEQRFGVKHKEHIKKFKATVDILTLTATPIPRTLNFSLVGIRDISIINTAPINRHAISTHVASFEPSLIAHAIRTELERKGQIFFVHNRVQTIDSMHAQLKHIVPEAKIAVAHGQMKEGELEKIMIRFIKKEFDVLLCTTIIESGLDVPNANTIIINRADSFGLAQLYQMRGRVGRSDRYAFAYLLVPPEKTLSSIAKRRLATLQRFTELGSGFQIAMHDLEIRGAGNILGTSQSGHINDVGYELYTKLLEKEIKLMSSQHRLEDIDPELHLHVQAFLPDTYIQDEGVRIETYRRLANLESEEEIGLFRSELEDRFGHLPQEAINLCELMKVKSLARQLRIVKILASANAFTCKLSPDSPLSAEIIITLVQEKPQHFGIKPPSHLLLYPSSADTLFEAKKLLSELLGCVSRQSS